MENDFKIALFISCAIHVSIFLIITFAYRRSSAIILPVELFFYNPPASLPAAPVAAIPSQEILQKLKEKDEVAMPLKKKEKLLKKARKKAPEPVKPAEPPKTVEPAKPAAPPAPTTGEPLDRNYSPSSQISLDTTKFPFTYYTNTIVRKIGRSWQWSSGFGQLKTVVYFKIQRDGSVEKVKVDKTSGDRFFDSQATRAIELASPFPPLPDGFSDSELGVYFEFGYRQ